MERCDVLIVGGGPAGSTCAWQLRRAGLDVMVLDRSEFPRDKVCAGWVTPQIVRSLELDLEDYRRDHVLQPLLGFSTGLVGGRSVAVGYEEPISYAIRRCEFDHYLLRRADARLRLGEQFDTAVRSEGEWLVNGVIRARVLVGAGGHFCPVARLLGAELGRSESVIAAQELEVEMDGEQCGRCAVAPDLAELYFCTDLEGYGWCVRKGNFINVGLGRTDSRRLPEAVKAFWDWLLESGRIPAGLVPKFKGHAYLLYGESRRPLLGEQAVLIGDAAGLAYDFSGEGIRPAVESGLLAAGAIARGLAAGRLVQFEEYAAQVAQRFGTRRPAPRRNAVLAGLRRLAGRLLVRNARFARQVILEQNFLHRDTPALLPASAAGP
jgi:menaquinone-9 beta-reductase